MTEVVSVKFKNNGKAYYFDPDGNHVEAGEDVIVETSKGLEYATCVIGNHYIPDDKIIPPIRPVVRVATDNDKRVAEINRQREAEAMVICRQKIAEHGLEMKLVGAECSFEGGKTTFFFTSDGRVDFRELVKDLASVFRNRIELRQIGVRDEAKMLGGIGICGRPFCCSQFLDDFQPVSTKMAKTQSMSLNPAKISGTCGRLMCCLRYEEEAYEDLVKTVPKNGAFVETPAGYGNVTQVNLLRRTVKVRLDGEGEDVFKTYSADEVATIPGGRPKPGEPLPHLLKTRPAEEAPADTSAAPAAEAIPEQEGAPAAEERRRVNVQREGAHREQRRHFEKPRRDREAAPRREGGQQRQEKPHRGDGQRPDRQGGKPRDRQQRPPRENREGREQRENREARENREQQPREGGQQRPPRRGYRRK